MNLINENYYKLFMLEGLPRLWDGVKQGIIQWSTNIYMFGSP